jgi:ATP-dependent exoDNAse (exonuclease V) beta subunit
MPEVPVIQDAAHRERALDPARSFLVQAPAGSGKTELLIQRYLVLLARVDHPESVIAITFTRKAAGEMRRRVLQALEGAAGPEPDKPHKAKTWRLARDVRGRDLARGWGLAENPSRLRIRTIDSFGDSITRRMPWLSRMGAQPELVDDARELYREAARNTIALLGDESYGPHLERVLLHVDNDFGALEKLLAEMLARRDQWLRHLAGADPAAARPLLEESLRNIIAEALEAARAAVPDFAAATLPALARHAAGNVDKADPIAACSNLRRLPDDLPQWLGLAALLLTGSGTWRKKPNRTTGFLPKSPQKEQITELLEALEQHDEFRIALANVRRLPPAEFDEGQWNVLEALIPVLLAAAAQLRVVFRSKGQADFSELSLAALHALGADEEPTDLAVALDYQIQHLLVDEFQDTSITQFKLLEKLTAGWEPGDGRTLFAVGDPMQSIYRFREAEVALFLKAAREGIGSVRLESLRLSVNFRSEQGVVEWVNTAFPGVLAPADDMATGAVRFSSSVALKPPGSEAAVKVHPFLDEGDDAEAARVVEIVNETRARTPEAKIAVLVRARTHLPSILRALRVAELRYRAVEIDQLGDVAITQDLLALTRALLHPADRVAWLAVLRAPWCGLTLADLHALAADSPRTPVWDLLQEDERVERLSPDGQSRLLRARAVLATALDARGARLRSWVEGCWLALGGPACATNPGEIENAAAYFDLLEALDEGCDTDIDALAVEVDRLFAAPDPEAGDSLEVMTIHKAKGLEFDVVILPGLGRKVQSDDPRLLAWLERPSGHGRSDLVLAPVKPAGAKEDQLYDYVKRVEKEKSRNETARLLYVAATRARQRLHLLGQASVKLENGVAVVQKPSGSLLGHLWRAVEADFTAALAGYEPPAATPETIDIPPAPIRRLRAEWALPAAPPAAPVRFETAEATEPEQDRLTFEWVGDTLRHIGTVVHRMLQQIALEGGAVLDIEARRPAIETALRTLGVPPSDITGAATTVVRAVAATLEDERGRWILDGAHVDARSEYAVTGIVGDRLVTARVDRTFVDADGARWIIDFKTSEHEGGDRDAFLDNERERYRKKMSDYARLFAKFEPRPVRMGLYFPLLRGWREYEAAKTGGAL